jgi:hypothetical protein
MRVGLRWRRVRCRTMKRTGSEGSDGRLYTGDDDYAMVTEIYTNDA